MNSRRGFLATLASSAAAAAAAAGARQATGAVAPVAEKSVAAVLGFTPPTRPAEPQVVGRLPHHRPLQKKLGLMSPLHGIDPLLDALLNGDRSEVAALLAFGCGLLLSREATFSLNGPSVLFEQYRLGDFRESVKARRPMPVAVWPGYRRIVGLRFNYQKEDAVIEAEWVA